MVFASDERDRFGHLEDPPDFDQRTLEVGFGGGCPQTQPHAEAFAFLEERDFERIPVVERGRLVG